MLTPKMMAFCEAYLTNGGNGTEAYLTAYDSNSRVCANIESTRLLARDEIKAYLEKLRKPVEEKVTRDIINEREYKKKLIQERIDECVARGDDAAIARYLEIWNKMDGEYINISKDITDKETKITSLDNETLIRLAKAE